MIDGDTSTRMRRRSSVHGTLDTYADTQQQTTVYSTGLAGGGAANDTDWLSYARRLRFPAGRAG